MRLEIARKQTEKHNRWLRDLQNEQQKLLQLFYRDGPTVLPRWCG